MKVAVVGAGAIGAFIGARMALAANNEKSETQVVLIGRKTLADAVDKEGEKIESQVIGGKLEVLPTSSVSKFKISASMEEAVGADIIIIAVKSRQTDLVTKELATLISGAGQRKTIISLQNGVANPAVIKANVGDEHDVVAGMVGFNVVWRDHAVFTQETGGGIRVNKNGEHVAEFMRLLENGGVKVDVSADISPFQYGKICLNLTVSSSSRPALCIPRQQTIPYLF